MYVFVAFDAQVDCAEKSCSRICYRGRMKTARSYRPHVSLAIFIRWILILLQLGTNRLTRRGTFALQIVMMVSFSSKRQ